jgi:hypothetical protein
MEPTRGPSVRLAVKELISTSLSLRQLPKSTLNGGGTRHQRSGACAARRLSRPPQNRNRPREWSLRCCSRSAANFTMKNPRAQALGVGPVGPRKSLDQLRFDMIGNTGPVIVHFVAQLWAGGALHSTSTRPLAEV